MANNQITQEEAGEKDNIQDQLKKIFKKEGLSWQKLSDLTGDSSRASLRRNLFYWLQNANLKLNKIGYAVRIYKIDQEPTKKNPSKEKKG